ncbi:hypothetical protein [Candidatus Palauibacter sp.]|uniref:hypothetical protein n=1 Tax=Candidatus Palauibacter sp. TaxID=3101350 RepID=UPI003AF20C7D
MRQREKYGRLSESDRLEIGDRIKNGQTHAEVAAAVGCSASWIRAFRTLQGASRAGSCVQTTSPWTSAVAAMTRSGWLKVIPSFLPRSTIHRQAHPHILADGQDAPREPGP